LSCKRWLETYIIDAERRRLAENEATESTERVSLLSRLVGARDDEGSLLSNEEIMDNILTIVLAGSDTTASLVTSLWLVISTHPKLKAQLKAITRLSSVNDDVTIRQFFTRVLATYPPVPIAMRLNVDSDPIHVTSCDVPSEWMIVYGFAGVSDKSEPDWNLCIEQLVFRLWWRPPHVSWTSFKPNARRLSLSSNRELDADQNLEQRYTPGFFLVEGLRIIMKAA
jgi:hypothetical protein